MTLDVSSYHFIYITRFNPTIMAGKRRIDYCHILWKGNRRTRFAHCKNPFCYHIFRINDQGSTRFYCSNNCTRFMCEKRFLRKKYLKDPQISLRMKHLRMDV